VSEYVGPFGEFDASSFEELINEEMEAAFEGWSPARGGLLTWFNKARSRIDAILGNQLGVTAAAAFKKFGETIGRTPPILAAPATAQSTWTMIDNLGHTIEDGTEVAIPINGDEVLGFVVVGDVVVPPGSEATGAGAVLLQAITPGTVGNNLSATPRPISASTAFVDTIALVGVTSGGVDEEDEDDYLDRLTVRLRLLSLSLIVASDFEIDAVTSGGIARALCLPGYNAETAEADQPLCFTNFPLTEAGQPPSGPAREALQASAAERVPSGVKNFVGVPTYTTLDVWAEVVVAAGFDPLVVKAAVEGRLAEYLAPANWGRPTGFGDPGNSGGWILTPNVYVNEVISELDRVPGVSRVVSVLLGGTGGGKAVTIAASTDVVTFALAHGYVAGDAFVLRSGFTPGTPLSAGTLYYARDLTEKTLKVAATPGGAAINITADGAGTAVRLRPENLTLNGVVQLPELKTATIVAA